MPNAAVVPEALLGALLEGAFASPLWGDFLGQLRDLTHAGYVSLIFRQPAPSASTLVHLHAGAASPPLVERLYRESLHRRDPLPYRQLVEGRLYSTDELLRRGHPSHDAYRRDLLEPSGMNILRLMRIVEPGGVNVWLTLGRRDGDFTPGQDAMVTALAPYIRIAVRGFVALERERYNVAVATEANRRLNCGWLTLDGAGQILDCDRQGAHFLTDSGLLRRGTHDRLTSDDPDLDQRIGTAIRTIAGNMQGRPIAMVLNRDPWVDLLLVPSHQRTIAPGPAPILIAYIHSDSWSSADRCERIADLFQLLPSEARVALALGRGMSLAEAAADLGLTIETTRNYSKKIYAKTGTRGQTDLVRMIHRSVLAFG